MGEIACLLAAVLVFRRPSSCASGARIARSAQRGTPASDERPAPSQPQLSAP